MVPFIRHCDTAKAVWDKLEATYGKSSRGRIMALKSQLSKITWENKSITEYMLQVKSLTDEISTLDTPIGDGELTLIIIDGVGDDYKELVAAIRACDNLISFEELHEKLRNFEAFLEQTGKASSGPITANATTKSNNSSG